MNNERYWLIEVFHEDGNLYYVAKGEVHIAEETVKVRLGLPTGHIIWMFRELTAAEATRYNPADGEILLFTECP